MKNFIIIIVFAILTSGCATIIDDTFQSVMVSTVNNYQYENTDCSFSNEEGQWRARPGEIIDIYRDGNPLIITCQNEAQIGSKQVLPRLSAGLLAMDFMIDLCTISCIIDGISNSLYYYPAHTDIYMRNINEPVPFKRR